MLKQQLYLKHAIKGGRRITADTALRFSKYFGTTPKFWLDLQGDFDLEEEEHLIRQELSNIKSLESQAAS